MRNILLILGAVAALAIGAVLVYQWQGGPRGTMPEAPAQATRPAGEVAKAVEVTADDLVLGRADAPVTVIEYASLTCPHCRDFHVNVLPAVKKDYIDTGRVRFVLRDFPLDQGALTAAMLARCAGPERRYALLDLFFRRQESWSRAQDPFAALGQIAGLAGMADGEIQACLKNEAVERAVLDQRLTAEKAFRINATPSFVIGGATHSGGMTFEEFKSAVDPLIAAAGAPRQ